MFFIKFKKVFFFIFTISLIFIFIFLKKPLINEFKVHYIDVNQGDCSLIEYENLKILIDTGPNEANKKLINYLKKERIKTIDYIFITHPHEDHIGNLDEILSTFKVNNIFIPNVNYHSEDLIKSLYIAKKNNIPITVIKEDINLTLTKDLKLDIFASSNFISENLNDFSPIIKANYKDKSFLFTGDNEAIGEFEMLDKNLDSDILQVGHHGSKTSSTEEFLEKVSPKISIISCGKNNRFNHPHKDTLSKLNNYSKKIYRTDEDGSIIISISKENHFEIEKK